MSHVDDRFTVTDSKGRVVFYGPIADDGSWVVHFSNDLSPPSRACPVKVEGENVDVPLVHYLLNHSGQTVTERIISSAFIKGLPAISKRQIRDWYCTSCGQGKARMQSHIAVTPDQYKAKQPLERVCMDLMGPFAELYGGKRYLLNIIDEFSAYICKGNYGS